MRAPLDELARELAAARTAIEIWTGRAVPALLAMAGEVGEVAVVAVVVPRCRRVDDLRSSVQRRSFASCADEHLLADAVVTAASAAQRPVLTLSGPEVLQRASDYFGLDRQVLGHEANEAQPQLGSQFEYDHRRRATSAAYTRSCETVAREINELRRTRGL